MNKRIGVIVLLALLGACSNGNNDDREVMNPTPPPPPPPPQMDTFSVFARDVFNIDANGTPVEVNNRELVQDADSETFADLLP